MSFGAPSLSHASLVCAFVDSGWNAKPFIFMLALNLWVRVMLYEFTHPLAMCVYRHLPFAVCHLHILQTHTHSTRFFWGPTLNKIGAKKAGKKKTIFGIINNNRNEHGSPFGECVFLHRNYRHSSVSEGRNICDGISVGKNIVCIGIGRVNGNR